MPRWPRGLAAIGSTFTFFADNEIGIADRQSYDGGYWSIPTALRHHRLRRLHEIGDCAVDISGGRFLKGERRAQYVATIGVRAFGFSTSRGYRADDVDWMTLSFQPAALDVGDTDADGRMRSSWSPDGKIGNCHLDLRLVDLRTDIDMDLIDVAAGDIDDDASTRSWRSSTGGTPSCRDDQDYEGKDQPMTTGAMSTTRSTRRGGPRWGPDDEIAVLRTSTASRSGARTRHRSLQRRGLLLR